MALGGLRSRPRRMAKPLRQEPMIENQRVLVWAALGLLLYLNYITWQHDYAPPPSLPATATASKTPASNIGQALPDLPRGPNEVPSVAAAADTPATPVTPQ